jgi:hypothetical protein
MQFFGGKPKVRNVYLSQESGGDFPLDKKNRPLICKEVGSITSIFNAMSSISGTGKIKVKQSDFEGNVQIKESGSYLNIGVDFEIPNNFKRKKIGKYLGNFKSE